MPDTKLASVIDRALEPPCWEPEEPQVFNQGLTACPCCGFREQFYSEAWWDGNVQGDKWAVCQVTACGRCQYSPERWDGTEADWTKQADEYRTGWLQELSDTLLTRCKEFFSDIEISSGRATPGSASGVVNAAIDIIFEGVSGRLESLCRRLDTLEGCREVATEEVV